MTVSLKFNLKYGREELTKPQNSSAMAPHNLIHYTLTRLRRQREDRMILIFAFLLKPKSPTPINNPLFQGEQAFNSRHGEALTTLQLHLNEVTVSLLFH